MPAAAAGSGTRSHSPSALCRWRRASAGARTASASSAARTDAASAPTRSWLARQWWASSAAAPPESAAAAGRRRRAAAPAHPAAGRRRPPPAAAHGGTRSSRWRRRLVSTPAPTASCRPCSRSASGRPATPASSWWGTRRPATAATRSTLLGRLGQSLEPGQQHLGKGRRQLDRARRRPRRPAAARRRTGCPRSGRGCPPAGPPAAGAGDRLQVLGQLGPGEGGQLQPFHPGQPDQLGQQRPQRVTPMQLIGAVADRQRHPARPQRAGQEGDQVPGGAVGPVQVLQHHHHRGPLGQAHQHGPHGVEHLQLVQAVAGEPGRLDPGQQPAQPGRGRGRTGQQPGLLRVISKLAQGVHHGQIGQADVAQLDTAPGQHPHPTPAGPVGQRQQQPGLPTPASPATSTTCGRALLGPFQRRVEPAQLDRPADERRARELPSHARQYGRRPWEEKRTVTVSTDCC